MIIVYSHPGYQATNRSSPQVVIVRVVNFLAENHINRLIPLSDCDTGKPTKHII